MKNSIQVKNLTKTYQINNKPPGLKGSIQHLFRPQYNYLTAVDSVSFQVGQGELVGFIGPNGAGKTTTLKCLSGLLHPSSGKIKVLGHVPQRRDHRLLRQISLVMGQKNQLIWDLPPLETFLLNQAIYEIPEANFSKDLRELAEMLGMTAFLEIPVRKLSLGQRMKSELIAALLHRPRVLFLDEPTIGLDVVMQKAVRDFIKEYNQRYQATIMLTSHYMDDLKQLAKRVIIIDQGRLLFDGKFSEVIDTYARNKLLSLVLSEKVSPSKWAEFGTVTETNFPMVQLAIPRQKATQIAAKLLQELPIIDLTIEEPPVEAIIREVFTKEN